MTQEEWLNFQYSRNQAARGGIMHLRNGGRSGFENGSYPTNHKFWELVDWKHEDKKSKDQEDAINADMEAGMSWDDIKKKYNFKDFEDVSIKETEREETDSGNKVKEIFETIKEKVGSISFAKGGRTGYKLGVGPVDPEEPPIYLPDPNEYPANMNVAGGENNRVRELLLKEEVEGLSEDEKEELRQLIKTISAQGPVLPNDPTEPVNPFAPKPTGPVLPDRMMAAQGGRIGFKSGYSPGVVSAAMDKWNSVYGTDASGEEILVKDLYSGGFEEFLEIFVRDRHAQGGRIGFSSGGDELSKMAMDMFQKELRLLTQDEMDQLRYEWEMKKGRIEEAQGGRIGYAGGSTNGSKPPVDLENPQNFEELIEWMRKQGYDIPEKKAQGGRIKKDNGGIMNLGGMEKDYRFNGGFVPIGEYEKKDDVPARLSKNEFVMTADAVRAAGGGSINQGAQRMYNIMKNLEAQPTAKRRVA
jgi:hypothetical protein